MVEWVSKEFAEDYGLEYDVLIKPQYYVHINDANYQTVMDKYYKEQKRREWNRLSIWGKIKLKLITLCSDLRNIRNK